MRIAQQRSVDQNPARSGARFVKEGRAETVPIRRAEMFRTTIHSNRAINGDGDDARMLSRARSIVRVPADQIWCRRKENA